jgi:hypothetical protein
LFGSATVRNCRTEDSLGGVRSLIDNGKSSQADVSVPNETSNQTSNETSEDRKYANSAASAASNAPSGEAKGVYTKSNPKPLFKSLVGFALEVGDRLLINDLEVIFKGWVDQSQTAIEVMVIAGTETKLIRAKEIKSLARSQDISSKSTGDDSSDHQDFDDEIGAKQDIPKSSDPDPTENNQAQGDRRDADRDVDVTPEPIAEDIPEIPKEPEYNAWEVWTYLERQRVKTLKLLNTFRAEWEANRFVREAERSAPSNLRVHYEIRPVCLDESEINGSYQNIHAPHPNTEEINPDAENYADVIDVEVIN